MRPPAAARRLLVAVSAIILLATFSACAVTEAPAAPPAGAAFDYQLGGAYEPDSRVGVVARDRTSEPAEGVYSICYVNGFQTQPGESGDWPEELLLHDHDGELVIDPDWPDENLVDTRDPEAVIAVVGDWVRGCASDGFDAVEFDNLDTYTRSDGLLTRDDTIAVARGLVDIAHQSGLAAAQKNAAEDAALLREQARFDFAVVEECMVFDECGAYTDVYGDHVLAIEYTDALPRPFDGLCADPDRPASIVLRDRDLTTPDNPDYVFELCP